MLSGGQWLSRPDQSKDPRHNARALRHAFAAVSFRRRMPTSSPCRGRWDTPARRSRWTATATSLPPAGPR